MSRRPHIVYLLSGALSLVAVVWVGWNLGGRFDELSSTASAPALVLAVLVGGLAYGSLTVMSGVAWWWLLGVYDRRPSLGTASVVWVRSQIARYLPGNVLHYASRHAMGLRVGVSHASLVVSGILEFGSSALAAVLIILVAATPATLGAVGLPPASLLIVTTLALLLAWPLADRGLRKLPAVSEQFTSLPGLSYGKTLRLLAPALLLHLAFLSGTGVILLGLLRFGWSAGADSPLGVVGVYAVAWLAGTLMPGAPGGLGVREAVLVLLLGPSLGTANASALALTLRAATLTGDAGAAVVGWVLRPHIAAAAGVIRPTNPSAGPAS